MKNYKCTDCNHTIEMDKESLKQHNKICKPIMENCECRKVNFN